MVNVGVFSLLVASFCSIELRPGCIGIFGGICGFKSESFEFRKRHTKLNSPPIEVSLFFVCLLSFSFPLGNIPVLIKASLIDSVAGRFIFHPLSCLLWAYSLLIILPNKKSIYSSNIHWKILRSQQRKFLWLNHSLHGKGIRKWRKQGNENPFCLWGRKNRYKQTLRMNSLFFASHFYTLAELMLP